MRFLGLKRPLKGALRAAEVSLLIPEAHAAAISEDERTCAAGCDRDVRIFRADGANLKSMTAEMRLEGPFKSL